MIEHARIEWPGLENTGRTLPSVFDRVAVLIAVLTHLAVLAAAISERDSYRSFAGMLALVAFSAAVPLVCVASARRSGQGLTRRAFLVAGAALILVSGAQALVVPIAELGSLPAPLWEATGVNILILSAYRSAREILWLGAVATVPAIVLLAPGLGEPDNDFRFLAALSSVLLPALASAQYLREYILAVRVRQDLAEQAARATSRAAVTEMVQRDSVRRLESTRDRVVPLLAAVSRGELAPDDPQVAGQARELAAKLREELIRSRSGEWLIDSPGDGPALGSADRTWPGVTVLDPEALLPRLPAQDRARVSVLLEVLRGQPEWEQVSLALSSAVSEESSIVTVVARGPSARTAAADLAVRSAAAAFAARLDLDDEDVLVAESIVTLPRTAWSAP